MALKTASGVPPAGPQQRLSWLCLWETGDETGRIRGHRSRPGGVWGTRLTGVTPALSAWRVTGTLRVRVGADTQGPVLPAVRLLPLGQHSLPSSPQVPRQVPGLGGKGHFT